MVQDGGWGAVGATKSVEEMMAGAGIVIGCGEGLERNRAATIMTRRMMPCDNCSGARPNPPYHPKPKNSSSALPSSRPSSTPRSKRGGNLIPPMTPPTDSHNSYLSVVDLVSDRLSKPSNQKTPAYYPTIPAGYHGCGLVTSVCLR